MPGAPVTSQTTQARNRINEIDLLRFVAAVLVVLFHYAFRGHAADDMSPLPYPLLAPLFKYGYLGVNLFFLISGFVILMTAANGSFRAFAISRIVRLYPAFWVCCTITALVGLASAMPLYAVSLGKYLANMTMLNGFFGTPHIDGVYWSLFVEIKFYLIVAAILLIGAIRFAQPLLALWLVAAAVLEFHPLRFVNYLLLVDTAAYFIGGATFFLIWSRGPSPARYAIAAGSWLLALHQALAIIPAFDSHYHTTMSPTVIAAAITGFYLVMLTIALRRTGAIGRRSWVVTGALTYPLYLLHQNVGYILFSLGYPVLDPHVLFWSTFALMLALSYAVHVAVEKPMAAAMKPWLNAALDRTRALVTKT
jgi:peptidoglycan/LPS O-acetylase OafA/YrhL